MSTLKVTNIEPQSGTDVHITGSLIVSNIIRAREVLTTLSSSQVLVSGSTKFGDSADDTHIFTGSVAIEGNITTLASITVGTVSTNKVTATANGITGSTEFTTIVNKPTLLSSSAQIAGNISGSFTAASSSFSTRITTEEANVNALQTDSGSFSTRITAAEGELGNTLLSSSAQIATDISGSFTAASSSLASRVTTAEGELGNTLLSSSAQIAGDISGSFTSTSASIATNIATNVTDISTLTSVTSSYVNNSNTASFASTGSNTLTGNQTISSSVLLTLQQFIGSPAAEATGSLIVSGSPVQLYIYNGSGSGWNRV